MFETQLSDGCNLLVVAVTVIATTAAATATAATPSTTTATLEAVSLVVITTRLPVTLVTTAAAATSAATFGTLDAALEEDLFLAGAGLHLALLNELGLLVQVVLLLLDDELLILPLGGGVQGNKGVGFVFRLKLNEDRALEFVLLVTPQLHQVDLTKLGEESLDVELSGSGLFAETLDVNAGSQAGLLRIRGRSVGLLALDRLLALLARHIQEGALLQRSDDGRVGLEHLHALEAADGLERNGLVLHASGRLPHELIGREVAVAEVELDLRLFVRHGDMQHANFFGSLSVPGCGS